ncbi:MAG: AraC family transcriptional regulator [Sphaerochaeta sp.]|jgi:AraC-like DNA-binding protein|nr:AraC family transcriptional regulator [Sphaerochaeta sp.]
MDYRWFDQYEGMFASMNGGEVFCGISSNTEYIHRTTSMKEGMLLTWVITGSGELKTPEKDYAITDENMIFRNNRIDYQLTLYPGVHQRRCFLRLPDAFFSLLITSTPSVLNVPPVFPVKPMDEQRFADFMEVMRKIRMASDKDLLDMLPFFSHYITQCVVPCLNENGRTAAMEHARQRLETDYQSSIPEIAATFGLGYHLFRKEFKQTYTISPLAYRIKAKTEQAKQFLSMGYPCDVIAEKLGYPDMYTFSHQFKTVAGISPKNYQKKHIF